MLTHQHLATVTRRRVLMVILASGGQSMNRRIAIILIYFLVLLVATPLVYVGLDHVDRCVRLSGTQLGTC